ncbi:MAG: ComF family protein [Pedobacter sp.]|nr:MAG: ComF family protein [Pedobacter sp.]
MPPHAPYPAIDCILPVPLHPRKERQRGYNQSERIAQGIAQVLHVPLYTDILIRTKSGQSQTRKSRFQRYHTIQNVFDINFQKVEQIANKHVLLVDDVITSGSTLEACGNTLWENQIKALSLTAVAYSKQS